MIVSQKYIIKLLARFKNNEGATLVELVTVMVIIAILAGLQLSRNLTSVTNSRITKAVNSIAAINDAQAIHLIEYGYFAPNIDSLASGVNPVSREYLYSTSIDPSGYALSLAVPQTEYINTLPPISGKVFIFTTTTGEIDNRKVQCVGIVGSPPIDMSNIQNETQCPNTAPPNL